MTTETKFTVGEYKTRDGRRARVYATDGGGAYTIQGAIFDDEDLLWLMHKWNNAGRWFGGKESDNDLMPPLREWWAAVNCVTGLPFYNDRTRDEVVEYVSHLRGIPVEIIRVREVPDDQA